jgi:hypothetical protein
MGVESKENPSKCASQNRKAKSVNAKLVGQIAKLVRRAGLDCEGWRYVNAVARE